MVHPFHVPSPFDHRQPGRDHVLPLQRTDVASFENVPFYGATHGYPIISPLVPRQLALPAISGSSVEGLRRRKEGLSFAEHALRRKTPNGTIDAGYDATPVDDAIPVPATKHILVSSLPERGNILPVRTSIPPRPTLDSLRQPQYYLNPNSHPRPPVTPNNLFSYGNGHLPTASIPSYDGWEFPGGLDSILNQALPNQPSGRFYLQHGSTVPTVLPSNLQPYSGPTASAGSEFYGRFLPNESYAPYAYQQSPMRDVQYSRMATNNPQPASHLASPAPWIEVNCDSLPPPIDYTGALPHLDTYRGMVSYEHAPGNSFSPGPGITQSGNILPTRRSDSQSKLANDPSTNVHGPFWNTPAWPNEPVRSAPDVAPQLENVESREKIFLWAQSSYVSLLASIHRARSREKPNANSASIHSPKPNIFPKPPRQPHFDFSTVGRQRISSTHVPREQKRLNEYDSQMMHSVQPRPAVPGTIVSPSQRQNHHWSLSDSKPAPSRLQSFSERDRFNGPIPKGNPYLGGMVAVLPADQTAEYSAAASALEMITFCCERSDRSWIEGMLLAGCLAYGLGHYGKAFDWYQAVLARDESHVEAISNVAATFLAVNRRDEALQYWRQAVRLQPSYFEAVEHLIGLLCSSQKTADAVKVLEFVEQKLRLTNRGEYLNPLDHASEGEGELKSPSLAETYLDTWDRPSFDFDEPETLPALDPSSNEPEKLGYGSSGFAIPGSDNGRMLALIHAKGNMLYSLNDNRGAAAAFEEAILIGAGRPRDGIRGLIREILMAFESQSRDGYQVQPSEPPQDPILLYPDKALQTACLIFGPHGRLPGLEHVPEGAKGQNHKAAVSTTSNSLLSLAKIYQDGLSSAGVSGTPKTSTGVRDILALYYLSLSLQPSPSTANNVGILLASVQQVVAPRFAKESSTMHGIPIPGVAPGSGIALALSYYNYGLNLDSRHAHLFTNLGSLLKDIGQLKAAVKMYEEAVKCDPKFDIALANLANAVKDQGMVADAIVYYKRAVDANENFAEAVCGLATALNSVCDWKGRGGIYSAHDSRDRWHVDEKNDLINAAHCRNGSGWMNRVAQIVDKQLKDGVSWGRNTLTPSVIETLSQQLTHLEQASGYRHAAQRKAVITKTLQRWAGQDWEGARIVWLIESAIRRIGRQWYRDRHQFGKVYPDHRYTRPTLPAPLSSPNAPTVLPFHTFTAPLSAKQIRQISQRNGLRISVLNMRSSWLPTAVLPPPPPPNPYLKVGYVSSDFNNHPLAHLMQSVFGMHDPKRVRAYCYATTPSDNSVHRRQIEREAPEFYDASSWNVERLVKKIVDDGIHVLVNLNGYTRGARNEVFAARPAPIQMSFMGFAGTLGADWCDYILADEITIPQSTLSPWRRRVDLDDRLRPDSQYEDEEDWIYAENIIFTKDTFFCCDHRQSAPDAIHGAPPKSGSGRDHAWQQEQLRRWKMRKELFPNLSDDAIILGNFNQLYKVCLKLCLETIKTLTP